MRGRTALFGCCAVLAAACSGGGGPHDVVIGFAQQTDEAPFYRAMDGEAARLARQERFTLEKTQAGGDAEVQVQQIADLVDRGVDVLVINSVSATVERPAVAAASRKVPVIFVDTPVPDAGQVTEVVADNREVGTRTGRLVARRLGVGSTVRLGVLTGGPADTVVGPAREAGFLAGLAAGEVEAQVVTEVNAKYTQELAVSATEDMLTLHPDLDLVFGLNDSMALGALSALRARDDTAVLVAGIDGQKEALAQIHAGGCTGRYVATGRNSPVLAMRQALGDALALAREERSASDFPARTTTPADGIDCRNVDAFYDPTSPF